MLYDVSGSSGEHHVSHTAITCGNVWEARVASWGSSSSLLYRLLAFILKKLKAITEAGGGSSGLPRTIPNNHSSVRVVLCFGSFIHPSCNL